MSRLILRVAATLVATLLLTGCGIGDGLPSPNANEDLEIKRQELLSRPSMEETDQRYLAFEAELKQALTEHFGAEWQYNRGRGSAGCKHYSGVGGESHTSQSYFFEPPITDEEWPEARRIVTRIGEKYGFERPDMLTNQLSGHAIRGSDKYGGGYDFATGKRTTFYTSTGCHLPEKYFDAPPTWQDNVDGDEY